MNTEHVGLTPEVLIGIAIVVLLAGLIYGAIRAGRLNREQRRRTDAATREMQQRAPESHRVE
jgi:hypothetical protein